MLPDPVSNPGPLTYESGALPIALRGPAKYQLVITYTCTHDQNTIYSQYHTHGRGIKIYGFNRPVVSKKMIFENVDVRQILGYL